MIKQSFANHFANLPTNQHVDDTLFDTFLAKAKSLYAIIFTPVQITEWRDIVIKTALFNKRNEVLYSDLWAITYSDLLTTDQLEVFQNTWFMLVFKTDYTHFETVKTMKLANVKSETQSVLSAKQIDALETTIKLTERYITELNARHEHFIASPDFANHLTQNVANAFYSLKFQHMLNMLKWQKLGCEINLGR